MVKRREPLPEKDANALDAFVNGADKETLLDPRAKRDYKTFTYRCNEHEYRRLEEAAAKSGRPIANFMRHAINHVIDDLLNKNN